MTISKKVKELNMLSETGKKIMELKKVLLANSENDLVYDGLLSSIKKSDYPEDVFDALSDLDCDEKQFQAILLPVAKYTNRKELKKQLDKIGTKLTGYLEKNKGQKHFTVESSLSKGCISVIKKIGINNDFIRREFRLNAKEANKLIKDGFVEKYAILKLNAIVKGMVEKVENEHGNHKLINLRLSDFYHDEVSGYYNVDVVADISITEKQLNDVTRTITSISIYLDKMLNTIAKAYHKSVNR